MVRRVLSARELALRALLDVEKSGAFTNLALSNMLNQVELCPADRGLLFRLTYGTVAMRMALDYLLEGCLSRHIMDLPAPIRNILRMGAYQILHMDRIPKRAAVDEAVKLAHRYGHRGTANLVNAVLRRLGDGPLRPWPNREDNPGLHLAIRYSHPLFLVKRYLDRLGLAETEEVLFANNEEPELAIRANRLKISPHQLADRLQEQGVESRPGRFSPAVLYLDSVPSFTGPLFTGGFYTVQGEASALVSEYLSPSPGQMVLDLCAAPGGKSTHLAELMDNSGSVVALDASRSRLQLVRDNALRLGCTIIQTVAAAVEDARNHVAPAECVLLDAPCSGFGVIRHKPDIRYNRREKDIASLSVLQKDMIMAAADLTRPGGKLLYSVCTTEPEETAEVTAFLLSNSDQFLLAEEKQFWTHRDGIDGFYIALFKRGGT